MITLKMQLLSVKVIRKPIINISRLDSTINSTIESNDLFHTGNCIEKNVRLLPTATSQEFYTNPPAQASYFIKDELRVGRVEVCTSGVYKTLCDDQWDSKDASVVCHQLGFSRYGKVSHL